MIVVRAPVHDTVHRQGPGARFVARPERLAAPAADAREVARPELEVAGGVSTDRQAVHHEVDVRLAARRHVVVVSGPSPDEDGAVTGRVVAAARTSGEAAHGTGRDGDELVGRQGAGITVVGRLSGVLDAEVGMVGGGGG